MPIDFKIQDKHLYQPGTDPVIIEVPVMRFIAIDGQGDPNTSPSYVAAVQALYGLSYGIKMAHKDKLAYVVAPLEGFWQLAYDFRGGSPVSDKSQFLWTMLIRQPDFVTEAIFEEARDKLAKKKPALDLSLARLIDLEEGLCVQAMHIGPYDSEPATLARMDSFAQAQGYLRDFGDGRRHHEIYLSDPRKSAQEKLKTVLRDPIRRG